MKKYLNKNLFLFLTSIFLIFYILVSYVDIGYIDISYMKNYFMYSTFSLFRGDPLKDISIVRLFIFIFNLTFVTFSFFYFYKLFIFIINQNYKKFISEKLISNKKIRKLLKIEELAEFEQLFNVLKNILRSRRFIFSLFFLIVSFYSLLVFRDFGISVDEGVQYYHSKVSARKVYSVFHHLDIAPESVREVEDLDDYDHKYYGVTAQLPLLITEYFPNFFDSGSPDFWYFRHLYVRIAFVVAGFCLYLMLKDTIKSNFLLLLILTLFFSNPRISAHSFYNIKDSLFLSFYTISTYLFFRYIKNRKFKDLIIFTFFTVLTINIRIIGILLPAYFLLWLILNFKKEPKFSIRLVFIFGILLLVMLYITWPLLWGHPLSGIIETFMKFSQYDAWDKTLIFSGVKIGAKDIPLTYIPVWILISSPVAYLIMFSFGILFFHKNLLLGKSDEKRFNLVLFSLFTILISYFLIIILKPKLNGDWRHFYYLYTPMIVLGGLGMDYLLRKSRDIFIFVVFLIIISLSSTYVWMYKNHPHYYVFLNSIFRKNSGEKWDRDIWRVSSKQVFEGFFDSLEDGDSKFYFLHNEASKLNISILPKKYSERIVLVDSISKADYVIEDYRSIIGNDVRNKYKGFVEDSSVKVDGYRIMTIFRRSSLLYR